MFYKACVCVQDYAKSYGLMPMKLGGKVRYGPNNNPLNFGGDRVKKNCWGGVGNLKKIFKLFTVRKKENNHGHK